MMIIRINRSSPELATIVVGNAVRSIDIVEIVSDSGGESSYWLLISGECSRQWFVASRLASAVAELVTIRDDLETALKADTHIDVLGSDQPTAM
jgi:hypothetical protein